VRVDSIQQGLEILTSRNCNYVFSATAYAFPVQRGFKLDAHDRIEMLQPDAFSSRSQDLEEYYHDAGP
ncbi:pseudaminic acid cytidylyltransferase, partial [Vibrio breoganii]